MENAFCTLVRFFVCFVCIASCVNLIFDRYCWMVIVLVVGSFVVLVLGGKYFLLVICVAVCVVFVGFGVIGVVLFFCMFVFIVYVVVGYFEVC